MTFRSRAERLVPRQHGKGVGGFTIDVLRDRFPEAQRREYDEHPPFAWYRHREGTSGIDELEAVPICPQCGVRDITLEPSGDALCGVCGGGAVRCECPRCGAPLIRPPDAPRECHRCMNA